MRRHALTVDHGEVRPVDHLLLLVELEAPGHALVPGNQMLLLIGILGFTKRLLIDLIRLPLCAIALG